MTRPEREIDTDDETIRETTAAADTGEPVPIDVGVRAVTLDRVDLERGGKGTLGETIADWIRDAVEWWLEIREEGALDEALTRDVDDGIDRPAGYNPENGTPDEKLTEQLDGAHPAEWIGVTVELPAGTLEAIDTREKINESLRDPETVGDDVRQAVGMRFARIDRDLELTPTVEVDVPPAVAERAVLKAQYRAAETPDVGFREAVGEALLEPVQPDYEWLLDGEPVAAFDPETDGWDDPRGAE